MQTPQRKKRMQQLPEKAIMSTTILFDTRNMPVSAQSYTLHIYSRAGYIVARWPPPEASQCVDQYCADMAREYQVKPSEGYISVWEDDRVIKTLDIPQSA